MPTRSSMAEERKGKERGRTGGKCGRAHFATGLFSAVIAPTASRIQDTSWQRLTDPVRRSHRNEEARHSDTEKQNSKKVPSKDEMPSSRGAGCRKADKTWHSRSRAFPLQWTISTCPFSWRQLCVRNSWNFRKARESSPHDAKIEGWGPQLREPPQRQKSIRVGGRRKGWQAHEKPWRKMPDGCTTIRGVLSGECVSPGDAGGEGQAQLFGGCGKRSWRRAHRSLREMRRTQQQVGHSAHGDQADVEMAGGWC